MSRWRDRVKAIPVLGPLLRRAWGRVRPVSGVEWLDRRDDALMDSILWRMDLWLTGAPPLAENEFQAAVASGHYWNFLAGPNDWPENQPNRQS